MATQAPYLVIESRFAVPPAYALAWLTDFREDDQRLVGMDGTVKITRLPDGRIQRDLSTPMGPQRSVTTIDGPSQWTAIIEDLDKKGNVLVTTRVVETVTAEGGGTHHVATLDLTAHTFGRRVMMALMKPMARSMLRKIFTQCKVEMEAAHAAGKPPTA